MEFDDYNLVIIETMNIAEASAFIMFLGSEILRHKDDITKAQLLIKQVASKFDIMEV